MSTLDNSRRIEAARLAAGQCAQDPGRFTQLAEAIYTFLTAGDGANGNVRIEGQPTTFPVDRG